MSQREKSKKTGKFSSKNAWKKMWKSVKNGENFDYYRGKKAKKREKFHLRMRGKKREKVKKRGKF